MNIKRITAMIIFSFLLSSCTTTSDIDATWLRDNCPLFKSFTADRCESHSNCSTDNGTICMCVLGGVNWYNGELKNGMRHGFGRLDLNGGKSYAGYWINGKRSCGIESNSSSDYLVYKNGKVVDSGNNIRDGVKVGFAVVMIAGIAYAVAKSGGSGRGGGISNNRSDNDWDWDWQPGSNTWACRGVSSGQYANLENCKYDVKDDNRWP